jgi:hypothetical protein
VKGFVEITLKDLWQFRVVPCGSQQGSVAAAMKILVNFIKGMEFLHHFGNYQTLKKTSFLIVVILTQTTIIIKHTEGHEVQLLTRWVGTHHRSETTSGDHASERSHQPPATSDSFNIIFS